MKAGSMASLIMGCGTGCILLIIGAASYHEYTQSPSVRKLWSGLSLAVSAPLTMLMGMFY